MTSSVPSLKLNNGNFIPAVGIGSWMGRVGEGYHVVEMVKKALKIGYRHIDTVWPLCPFGQG
jgi:glycerol 2-dehydrogenase (NADP+)